MKPFLDLAPEDLQALKRARLLPAPPPEAILSMSRQLAAATWEAVKRRPTPRGAFRLPSLAGR